VAGCRDVIEARIDQMLSVGVGENPRETLSELAKLGARLIIQRAVENEFDAWLGRARYERRPHEEDREDCSAETGLHNGFRPRRLQTAEGKLAIAIGARTTECLRLSASPITGRAGGVSGP
jgi:putative transposase